MTGVSVQETHDQALALIQTAGSDELRDQLGDEDVEFLAEVLATKPENLPLLEMLLEGGQRHDNGPIAKVILNVDGGKDVVARHLLQSTDHGRLPRTVAPFLANEPRYVPQLLQAFESDTLYRAHEELGAALATTPEGRQALTDIITRIAEPPSSDDSAKIRAARALGKVKASMAEIMSALVAAKEPETQGNLALTLIDAPEAQELVFEYATKELRRPDTNSNYVPKMSFLKALAGNTRGTSLLLKTLREDVPLIDPKASQRQTTTDLKQYLSESAAIGLKGHSGIEEDLRQLLQTGIQGSYRAFCIQRLGELNDTPFLFGMLSAQGGVFGRDDRVAAMMAVAHVPEGRRLLEMHLMGSVPKWSPDHDLQFSAARALATTPEGREILAKVVAKGPSSDKKRLSDKEEKNKRAAEHAAHALNPSPSREKPLRSTSDYATAQANLKSPEPSTRLRAAIDILAHTELGASVQHWL
jgi:hypothetical protein